MDTVTAIWAAAGTATITAGAAVVGIIMAGVIIIEQQRQNSRSPYHCPGKGGFLTMIGRAYQRDRSMSHD
jgi:hypothetical protein